MALFSSSLSQLLDWSYGVGAILRMDGHNARGTPHASAILCHTFPPCGKQSFCRHQLADSPSGSPSVSGGWQALTRRIKAGEQSGGL